MADLHRLPDGRSTTSDRRYVAEWRKFGRVVCKSLANGGYPGFTPCAFDPGIQVSAKGSKFMAIEPSVAKVLARLGGWKDVPRG